MSTWTNTFLNFLFENYEPHKYVPIKDVLVYKLKVDEANKDSVIQIKDFLQSLHRHNYIVWETNKGAGTSEKGGESGVEKGIISETIQARLTTDGYFKLVDKERTDEQHSSLVLTNKLVRITSIVALIIAFLSVIISSISAKITYKDSKKKVELVDTETKQSLKKQAEMLDSLHQDIRNIDSTILHIVDNLSQKFK